MAENKKRNVLFIMCDQLRFDYLSCYGHPKLETPNIDGIAQKGVRFTNAYVQSPVCGPSRMSTYTGRYARSHGATWNSFPLRVGEKGMGDHLRKLGVRTALCGKSHMTADRDGMEHFKIDPNSIQGKLMLECGFELWDRLDGVHPTGGKKPSHYNDYLQLQGIPSENPWEDFANAPEGDDGEALSAWQMVHADRPARLEEKYSETAYTTDRAIEFMEDAGDEQWCLHLSYIKPHWPYVASAPYHDMYGPQDVIPPVRSDKERENAHPLLAAFYQNRVSKLFSTPGAREKVIPVYMGMIKQIDDHIGRILEYLSKTGLDQSTLIVFTSDHGDYLGDHWLGEKDLYHECAVKVPLIVMDPSQAADTTRGTVSDTLVESIDLLPSFIEYFGGEVPTHIMEGHSLLSLLHGKAHSLREFVISEFDYSVRRARVTLDMPVSECRTQMVFDGRYKMINVTGFRPILFDLQKDPMEIEDIALKPDMKPVLIKLRDHLHEWSLRHHNRTTISDETIESWLGSEIDAGIFIGFWDEDDMDLAIKTGNSEY